MPEVTFTKEDLLKRKQLKAGWRTLRVKSVDERPGKSDPESTTWPMIFVVEEGEDAGVPINVWFSEKSMERVAEFLKCIVPEIAAGKTYRLEDTVGRLVQGYVEYDVKMGFNTIKDFKPLPKKVTA